MFKKGRWLIWFLPLCFLGLIILVALRQDRDFWRSPASLCRMAQEAASREDRPRALELARKAWAQDPENFRCAALLGRLYLEAGQPQKALEVSSRVLARNQGERDALKIQALALALLGQREKAFALLGDYLNGHPEDGEILESAAELAGRHPEDHPLAVTYYQRLYKLRPDPRVRRPLLDLLVSLNRFQEAIPLQEEEAAQFPENQEALHRLALLHYWQRDYQAATQVYQRLLERAAGDAALRLEAARSAEGAQEVDQALAHYLWLYGHHQGKKEYAVALARLWAQKGNHAEAAGVLAPLMQEQPEPELQRWYALELLLIGDLDKSLKAYEAAWEAGDTHKETIVNLARLYARKRLFAKAAAFWDEARRRQLLEGDLRWEAALTYSYARRFPEALEAIQPLHRQDPQEPRVLLFCGQLHFYQKHWDRAAHYFKAYLEKNPQDAEVRRQLAEVLSFQPETREAALEQYGEALKLKDDLRLRLRRITLLLQAQRWEDAARELKACPVPEDPQLLGEQAHLFLWLGDLKGALQYYDLFLKRLPQDPGGRLAKARVLTYLGRAPEALEILNRLRLEAPRDRGVRVAAIQAYLSIQDYPKALTLAQKELEVLPDLSIEERALLARCYAHGPEPKHLQRATDLLIQNLREDRYHHPSLLILTSILPRLPRYEDLNRLAGRIPGIRRGPEYAAALAFFDGRLGRHGGKLDYLLHVLQEYRHHHWPDSPGELLGLAWLAMELGDRSTAGQYYQRALKIRPGDEGTAALYLQCQMAQKNWSLALASLQQQGKNPGTSLEMARLYMLKGQYEGVKAMVAGIPETHPDRTPALFLLAQTYRREGNYPEALKTLAPLEGRIPRDQWLMEKARTLEAMDDKGAAVFYEEIVRGAPESQAARVAKARQARARGNWAGAHKNYTLALQEAPQDIELLNELEQIRQQMRPQMASRGFSGSRGERSPEEAVRPWQFSRFGREREPLGMGLSNFLPALLVDVLPIVLPETLFFTDSNKLHGIIYRVSGGFWITKVLPAQVAVEFRDYHQKIQRKGYWEGINIHGNLERHFEEKNSNTRLRRLEVLLGAGPLSVEDRIKLTGGLIFRRYWKQTFGDIKHSFVDIFGDTHFLPTIDLSAKEHQNRLLGTVEVRFQAGPRTEAALKYSRRDIFDQEAYLYPRLYQGILNLEQARITTLDQGEVALDHQFRPGLDWRGNLAGALYSDHNRRLTLYQGLAWQALRHPRMRLEFTPHLYLASYRLHQEAYFSPQHYLALGVGLDFHRQIFRLPTLILQGTVQGVTQHGQWGPSLQGLAALEWEFVQNFYMDLHVFYFREWVDQYRLLTTGVSFRWRF
jgi:tetratricopeptide (TPR) repeat protein